MEDRAPGAVHAGTARSGSRGPYRLRVKSPTFTIGNRTGRVFRCDGTPVTPTPYFDDADDITRDRCIALAFGAGGTVPAKAHPSADPAVKLHEVRVFVDVRPPGRPDAPVQHLFACVVMSRSRCLEIVRGGRCVVETFGLQVADTPQLDRLSVERAMRRWTRRNYAGAKRVRFELTWHEAP